MLLTVYNLNKRKTTDPTVMIIAPRVLRLLPRLSSIFDDQVVCLEFLVIVGIVRQWECTGGASFSFNILKSPE